MKLIWVEAPPRSKAPRILAEGGRIQPRSFAEYWREKIRVGLVVKTEVPESIRTSQPRWPLRYLGLECGQPLQLGLEALEEEIPN